MSRVRLYNLDKLVNVARDQKSNWNRIINSGKLSIFGHRSGYVGEEEWTKPLEGPSRTRYYWPSKYLHIDFTLRNYLSMQISRFKRKEDHPTIVNLWDLVEKFSSNRDSIKSFLQSVNLETFSNSITIQDTHSLYYAIFKESPLSFKLEESNLSQLSNPRYTPFINYCLRPLRETFVKKDLKRDSQERSKLKQLLSESEFLKNCWGIRNRFVDNLYLRRRNYYLDKLIRKKKISEIKQKYKSHFLTHPDEKKVWPDNKGIHQHTWPSR